VPYHYYEPVIRATDLGLKVWKVPSRLAGIGMHDGEQLSLLGTSAVRLPFADRPCRALHLRAIFVGAHSSARIGRGREALSGQRDLRCKPSRPRAGHTSWPPRRPSSATGRRLIPELPRRRPGTACSIG